MKSVAAFFLILLLCVQPGRCQEPSSGPSFDVASITPCKPGTPEPPAEHMGMVEFIRPGGRFYAKETSLKFLMEWAYGIIPSQHSDGPSWIGTDRYDIVAKADGNPSDADLKRMVQTLLADRFELKFHREKKEIPSLVLSVGATPPKLFPPKEGEQRSIRIGPQMGPDQKIQSWHVVATRFSFVQLNDTFARLLERVIVNETGLDGDFDFTLDMSQDDDRPNPLDPSMLITAMRDQLGLRIKSQKAPVDYFVIENAKKVVAGN